MNLMNRLVLLYGLGGVLLVGLLGMGVYKNRPVNMPAAETTVASCRNFEEASLTIHTQEFRVAVARTLEQKTLGLSGCPELPDYSGMYFAYDQSKGASFWMKDMIIPIDIIWIAEGKVVGVEENVPPPAEGQILEELPIYKSPRAVDGVLEIKGGGAGEYNIRQGDTVSEISQ